MKCKLLVLWCAACVAAICAEKAAEPPKPVAHTVRAIEGWTVHVDNRLLDGDDAEIGGRALQLLGMRLADIKLVVAPDRLKALQEVPMWLDRTHGRLTSMQYHPSAGWLRENGYSAAMEKCVHIPDARGFADPRHQQRQPWCVLHELAHAYHDRVLGFDEKRIKAAWQQAKDSGRYDAVLLIDGRTVKHYAMTNEKEFFAEMSEAYFGVNDFYPFNRAELLKENPELHRLLREIWGPVPDPAKEAPEATQKKALKSSQ
ncbi:MAG TPA: metallopeptidase [Planctomycetota bacterium]